MAERGTDQYLAERYPDAPEAGAPRPLRAGEKPLDSWQSPVEMVPSHGPYRQELRRRAIETPVAQPRESPFGRPIPTPVEDTSLPPAQPTPVAQPKKNPLGRPIPTPEEESRGALPPISRGGRQ